MTQILLYGVPGSGKTTSGGLLERQHGLRHIPGDYLREVAQSEHTEAESPFAYVGTCQAWAKFGALTTEHAVKGLQKVRDSLRTYIAAAIPSEGDYVFEVASLDPRDYLGKASVYLVTAPSERQHREQFFRERAVNDDTASEFAAARLVQDYLVGEAQAEGIPIIVNDGVERHVLEQFARVVPL